MEDLELCKIIDHYVENGIGGDDGELSTTRQTIFDRYNGELYGNEKEGESKITTREVFETVEWAMPSILRVFESGDRVVEFDPVGPDDEAGAEQETDAVNHVYQKDNNGFITTHNIVKSALMNPNSYVKVWKDESETVTTENYENLGDQEVMLLMSDPELELVGQEVTEYGYNLEVKRTCNRVKIKVTPLPEEDVIIASGHNELSLDDCECAIHKARISYSELIQRGYDAEKLDQIGDDDEVSSEETNRKTLSDERNDDESHKALRKFTVYECAIMVDYNDDGIAERRHVVKIGNEIFENEELDYMPIESAATIIMPHKHTGMSLAQTVIDLQDLKTFFMRQVNNNMARVNNPRTFINKNVNLADCLSNRTNGYVRVKEGVDPRQAASVEPITPIIGQALPLLDLIDQQKEGRSGITRNSMGLDADVLAKSTEGAFMGALEKAEQRVEFIVRVFAETVFKSVFLKIHHLLLTHGEVKNMKLNGQWVAVNPAEWKRRESMTVNAGLGLGNRRQKMAAAQIVIGEQDKAMQMGEGSVSPQQRYNARRLLVESVGEKNVDKYFTNPATIPPQPPAPPQPDPNMLMLQMQDKANQMQHQREMMKLQQQGQIKQAEMQYKAQIDAADMAFKQAESARKQRFDHIEMEYQGQIEAVKAEIAQERNDNDAGKASLQAEVDRLEAALKDAQADEKLAMDKYRADLDAEVKILLKQMDGGDPAATAQANNLDVVAAIITEMNRPKRIVRDDDGMPVGVEVE